MILQRLIIHELKKEAGTQNTTLVASNSLLPVDTDSIELVNTLLQSYQGDKILYAEFNNSPGRYFPERYVDYRQSNRDDQNFINYTVDAIGNLETIIRSKVLANKSALRKFIQINIVKDGINLKFSRGDSETKVRLSEEQPNIVIIESEQFARAFREQL